MKGIAATISRFKLDYLQKSNANFDLNSAFLIMLSDMVNNLIRYDYYQ